MREKCIPIMECQSVCGPCQPEQLCYNPCSKNKVVCCDLPLQCDSGLPLSKNHRFSSASLDYLDRMDEPISSERFVYHVRDILTMLTIF
jgi:hypothetical protein